MTELLIDYARVFTDGQDLTAQRDALDRLGVAAERIYVDHGLTATGIGRVCGPRWRVCREGDTLVVTKLDRLVRSLPDARVIIDDLTRRHVKLSIGGSLHGSTDPVGRLLFNVLAMVAEFESDLDPPAHAGGDEGGQGQGTAGEGSRSSSRARRLTWRRCTRRGSTARRSWLSCSGWAVDGVPSDRASPYRGPLTTVGARLRASSSMKPVPAAPVR